MKLNYKQRRDMACGRAAPVPNAEIVGLPFVHNFDRKDHRLRKQYRDSVREQIIEARKHAS